MPQIYSPQPTPQALNTRIRPLTYWANLYRTYQNFSTCLDIETEGINKPITIIGLYRPQPGTIHTTQLIQGTTLTTENLTRELKHTNLIITFNGLNMDIPRIRQQFPGTIPNTTPVLDLYRIAKRLNQNCNLTTLEQTHNIDRLHDHTKRKHIATKLWKKHQQGHPTALQQLLQYNEQDTINLYPLAETLCQHIENNPEPHDIQTLQY